MTTRAAFCLNCRARRMFTHLANEAYRCAQCGAQRSITIDASDRVMDGSEGRFWANVKVTPFCWPWVPKCSERGPVFKFDGHLHKAARVAFYLHHGRWPDGVAFRTCGNILCCRPHHIKDVPSDKLCTERSKRGMLRHIRWPRRKVCRRGHRLVGWNVGVTGKNRFCRTCDNEGRRKRRAELRASGLSWAQIR